jgi:hypothetical protein
LGFALPPENILKNLNNLKFIVSRLDLRKWQEGDKFVEEMNFIILSR